MTIKIGHLKRRSHFIFSEDATSSMCPSFRETWQAYETSQKLIEQLTAQHERAITTHLDSCRKGMEKLLANIEPNLPSVDVSLPSTIVEATNSKIEVLIENQRTDIEKLITFPPLPLQ